MAYLVCATERSGSTLLCEMLGATGVAGRPEEHFEALGATGRPRQPREYFDGVDDVGLLAHLPPPLPPRPLPPWEQRLAEAVRCGTTPNGVFATKVMWAYLGEVLAHGDLEELLGPLRWVYVARSDKVAQAVSLWRAIQTSRWRSDGREPQPAEPVFHAGAIAHLERRLETHDACWRMWFRERGIRPLEVVYEQLAEAPQETVRGLLEQLGLPCGPDVAIPRPPLSRQADALSREWAERFRARG